MKFGDGSESLVELREKTADYFGIKVITPELRIIQKKAYTYYRHKGLTAELFKEVRVPSSRYSQAPRLSTKSGRTVRVPTESTSPRGNVRTRGIKFPLRATYIDISRWLYRNCTRHKPRYFLTEAGKKRIVIDFDSPNSEMENW